MDPSLMGRDMEAQLRHLIIRPFQLLNDAAPLILLIDGLDECEGDWAQQNILSLIGKTIRQDPSLFGTTVCQYPSTFRFLLASRPELHIREKLAESSFHGHYDSVNVEQSFMDIRLYFQDEFARIYHEHSATMAGILTPWPSPDVMQMLVEKSSGYFIYASTVIKFIDDKCCRPTAQLKIVHTLAKDNSIHPFKALDELYIQILSLVPTQSRSKLCDILYVIANLSLKLGSIEPLLDLELGDVRLTLRDLHSVLNIGSEDMEITVHHASFLDFLNDLQRSSEFYIGPDSVHHMNVACAVLKALSCQYKDPWIGIAS
ncbi:hypothetical protein B0H13DRAFT_1637888 [Mycena leptocephala]|nr:hypothetical protein B0H13DRAFT_1637888 [Mycena leptocephala]